MGSVFQLSKLKRVKSGAWRGRKALPADVRAKYAALYNVRREPVFWRAASIPATQAKAEYAEWLALIERRISAIREARGGKGADLTQRGADALAGEWYRWFVGQHLDYPGQPTRWEGLRELFLTLLDDDEDDALDRLDHEARTTQFLLDHGPCLSQAGARAFLSAAGRKFVAATETLERRAGGDWGPDPHEAELLPTGITSFRPTGGPSLPSCNAMELFEAYASSKRITRAADSGRSRPRFQDEAARHSEIIPPSIPR